MIVSKRHPFKFYFLLSITGLFFCGIGVILLMLFILAITKDKLSAGVYSLPILSVFFFLFFYSMLKPYIKNARKIRLDRDFISFGNKTYPLSEISEISLTGKRPFKLFYNYPMEGVLLKFKNGATEIIFDDMYSNSWQIKSFLEKVVIEKIDYEVPIPVEQKKKLSVLSHERVEKFWGNQLLSLRGIGLWVPLGLLIGVVIFGSKTNDRILVMYIIMGAFWFFVNSIFMNYICLTKELLIIKNHNFLWKAKYFELVEIREVIFENTSPQGPNAIRILTKNYQNKFYPASTLRKKHWFELQKQLEAKGVKVRNECIC